MSPFTSELIMHALKHGQRLITIRFKCVSLMVVSLPESESIHSHKAACSNDSGTQRKLDLLLVMYFVLMVINVPSTTT